MKHYRRVVLPSVLLGTLPVTTSGLTFHRAVDASPVERVVKLLDDLRNSLQTDEKEEQQTYDKFACWCEKATGQKAAAIGDATNDIRAFGQSILSLKGSVATFTHEIQMLESLIRAGTSEVEQATSIRQKENAAFVADTTEQKQAIAAMDKAITVLVAGSSSLLQASARDQVKEVVRLVPITKSLRTGHMSLLSEYLHSGSAPQSMTVQGILKDMYESFAADLESSTQAEATANANFEGLIATKMAEIKSLETVKANKESQKADAEQQLADTQALYDDTQEQKKADIAFFDAAKKACASKHDAWTLRSRLRAEELAGIDEALKILTSDAARELFATAIKPGKEVGASMFLQMSSSVDKAYAVLKASAGAGHSLRLARLAAKVKSTKVGHFDEVLHSIDSMIQVLKDEDSADIAKRDQCKDEYRKIEMTVKDLNWKIEKNDAKIAKLSQMIEVNNAELGKTRQAMVDLHSQGLTLFKERNAEKEEFLKAREEDQQAILMLTAAKDAFTEFYKKNEIDMGHVQGSVKSAFVQEPEFAVSADQAPDADISDKGHRKNESKGIVSIMTMIIEDLSDEITNSNKAEEAAQTEYMHQMLAGAKLMDELTAKVVSLEGAIAKRTEERSAELEEKDTNVRSLDEEIAYKWSITPDCDWILGAFDGRAKARASEMSGLTGAKEFLAGKQP